MHVIYHSLSWYTLYTLVYTTPDCAYTYTYTLIGSILFLYSYIIIQFVSLSNFVPYLFKLEMTVSFLACLCSWPPRHAVHSPCTLSLSVVTTRTPRFSQSIWLASLAICLSVVITTPTLVFHIHLVTTQFTEHLIPTIFTSVALPTLTTTIFLVNS